MKTKNIIYLILLMAWTGCSSFASIYGDNYAEDKYTRNGFRGSSRLVIVNKTTEVRTITVDGIPYEVPPEKKGFLFSKPGKVKIPVEPGYHKIKDNIADELTLEVVPGFDYVHIFKGNIPPKALEPWTWDFISD